jgi:aspartate 1-decarboxylase
MFRIMHKSKIHRAKVTDSNLNYIGSITIDQDLMEAANILENEKVQVVNVNNGARFETYALNGKRGSGVICLNGAAARLAEVDDKVIIMTFGFFEEKELNDFQVEVVQVDDNNKIHVIEP